VLGENYNQYLADKLHREFGVPEGQAERMLDYIAECVLTALTLRGAINTPLGKLSLGKSGIQITEQNANLLRILSAPQSEDELRKQIRDILAG